MERGTLKVGVTESGSLEYNTKSIDYDLDLDVSDDDEDDSEDDDDDTVQKYLKIEEIYAASGQRVTEGEELLKFTEDSVVAVRALLQNAVVEAKADYAEAESTYELSLLEAQTDYDTQKISASYAASIRNTSGTTVANNVASLQVQMEQKKPTQHRCRKSWRRHRRIIRMLWRLMKRQGKAMKTREWTIP